MVMVHLVVAYDVISDTRRNRLAKMLKGYLQRVQKSVFEGELTTRRLDAMKRAVKRVIDLEEDTVRVYQICARCVPATEIFGVGTFVEPPDEDILF